ncbi:neutral/alkaline non-lysosomal ceramidase N-terminal domain-containing protein [Algoriphagus hitonicola]|uniref:Neutral/alkaline non-lysosomal ceramidase, N-terminal n=1 Tax=Algoriphagus hitonicola TaxID=435880 RepID=A0A1I2U328_9BACT|nr:neutral/alkaline non-lysosomal ceramidase N-terminal domain-containing protein [Algoriphagus hitonicola]SFG71474.1 Neutral/alkaline non-lysosomal ceramidase, N-terminal [Algoriphagus hitonicola]
MNWKSTFLTFGKILLGIFLFLVLVVIFTLTKVDRSPIDEQDFYRETFERLENLSFESGKGEAWLAGWGKANMTPDEPADLVGYAPRGKYEFVEDSSFVKSILLGNGQQTIAWLNFELLIVHPVLAQTITERVQEKFPEINQLHFTATHTHSGMGGYMPGPLGEFAFGGFDQKIVDLISEKSIAALQDAQSSIDTVSLSFRKSDAGLLVANRFVKDGPVDPFVRQLIFTKKSGKKATLLTFSAHATCLSSKFMGLSGDYPYYLMQEMERKDYDFSMFASGTVGSHRPIPQGNTPEHIRAYSQSLDSLARLKMTQFATVKNPRIKTGTLEIDLREPHLRISDNIRIRPWLFDKLLGETNPHFDITLLGNTLIISSSGEISGVFYEKWEELAEEKGLNLLITTFNGGYIGYITPDELYDEHYHEVREMNWYGPGNGYYFDQMIQEIIKRISP